MSPFMIGLMMGMTIFSAVSMQWAKQELVNIQKHQSEQATNNAKDLAGAMEFAMMTETKGNYAEGATLERARMFSNSTGKTRGDQNMLVTTRDDQNEGRFGAQRTQIAITASDDTLLRSQIHRSQDAQDLNRAVDNKQPVALFDTTEVRDRQVRTSATRMDSLAEQVYAYYAAKMKFPSTNDFAEISARLGIKDVWGQVFDYTVEADQQNAELSFTTPWDYTQRLRLSLKDDLSTAR